GWPRQAGPGRAADGGAEYAGLRGRRAELVRAALHRLGGASPLAEPEGASGGNGLEGQPHEDVGRLVDFLAAAVYLDDADLFGEHVGWLAALLAARDLPRTGAGAVLAGLAGELHDFPPAQRCPHRGRAALGAWAGSGVATPGRLATTGREALQRTPRPPRSTRVGPLPGRSATRAPPITSEVCADAGSSNRPVPA